MQGTGGQNLYQVDHNRPWVTPYVLNAIDPRRLLIGTNSLYESFDRGDTLTNLGSLGTVDANGNWPAHPMVYGGWAGGVANPDLIWVGAGGNLFLRTSGTGAPTRVNTYTAGGGVKVLAIAVDPNNWREAFVMDVNGNIWHTTDGGGSWTNVRGVTGNGSIGDLTAGMQQLAFFRSGSDEMVLVSSRDGVYATINPDVNAHWTKFGNGLPHAVVTDLRYYPDTDLLVAASYGRGAWTIPNLSARLRV